MKNKEYKTVSSLLNGILTDPNISEEFKKEIKKGLKLEGYKLIQNENK